MKGEMARKAKTKLKTQKVTTCEKLKTQIQKTEQTFLRKLQQAAEESCDGNDSNNLVRLLRTRTIRRKSPPRKDPASSHGNVGNKNITRDNYMCYRCQHFPEIPRNLFRSFNNRVSTLERCKVELSFVQAIVWLKSATTCASQIPVEQLQRVFDRKWNTRSEHHCENKRTDVRRLRSSAAKSPAVSERTNMRNTIATSTPVDISDVPLVTPQRTILYSSRFEDAQSKLSVSANDRVSVGSAISKNSNGCHTVAAREKRNEVESCIIPGTDEESIVSEDLDVFDSMPEHQSFEFGKNMKCSAQSTSTSGVERINEIIIENKHILQKSGLYANVPSESTLPARNQSTNSMFDLEGNVNEESFTSMRSQSLADQLLDRSDGSKGCIISEKDVSPMSNVNNDEYFDVLSTSFDNSPWQVSDTAAGNPDKDSAYSTSHIFNCDITVKTERIAGNKHSLDTEHNYKLQPCKKRIIYGTEKVSSSINRTLTTSDGSPKSVIIITQKDVSQISDIYNDENDKFRQIVSNYDERKSDIMFEDSEDDLTAMSTSDKYTSDIEHCYELHRCKKERITREKMTVSASVIQGAAIPDTNIQQACNNRGISCGEETPPSPVIGGLRESGQVQNLLQTENETEDKMISAAWLNFTLESLHIEHIIIKSIKVILSTLCDKETVREYTIKKWRKNERSSWKGSLEEEAVNTVLNISEIFTTERKPDICIKVIMTAIISILNEMTMRAQLNKRYFIETSVWIYRVQIILEFCNSLPICVRVADYLTMKLKSLQFMLINEEKIQNNTYVIINQLNLVFYALNITLRKYRTIIPSDRRSRSTEKMIPHVADLWKIHYTDKELEYTGLDLDSAEKRWLNTLENSAIVFTKHFEQFAEKSFSLSHVLRSQSSARLA